MKTFSRTLLATLFTLFLTGVDSAAAGNPDAILGVYEVVGETTHELSKVRIYRSGDTYEARIIWLEHPLDAAGNLRVDALNPDPVLRSVRADRIVLIRGLRYDSHKDTWHGGTIYNPVEGKSYDVTAEFGSSSVLKVRGYVGSPMFGRTLEWKKIE